MPVRLRLKGNNEVLTGGIQKLVEGTGTLTVGGKQLEEGTNTLKDGTEKLIANNSKLNSGVVQLAGLAKIYPVEICAFIAKIHEYLTFTYTVNAF